MISEEPIFLLGISGAPGVIRTLDLLVRSQTLYPAELRARSCAIYCVFIALQDVSFRRRTSQNRLVWTVF